jgi:hypothetical protein
MMQIYLPTPKLTTNAAILHDLDMLAQRNVGLTILESLAGKAKGWYWHPGITMWVGHEPLLAMALVLINDQFIERESKQVRNGPSGAKQLGRDYLMKLSELGFGRLSAPPNDMPWWWGNKRFHDGNKSVLIRRNEYWYGRLFKHTPNNLCDWWPRQNQDKWIYGPQLGPNGDYSEYFINDVPVLDNVRRMNNHEFAAHANRYHNLMDGQTITDKTATIDLLRTMHDRFHQKRFYSTHDHRG